MQPKTCSSDNLTLDLDLMSAPNVINNHSAVFTLRFFSAYSKLVYLDYLLTLQNNAGW